MRHSAYRPLVLAAALALPACSSNYHPEYHPVTVSNFSQNIDYPVAVHTGGATTVGSPVLVVPAQQPTVVLPAIQAEPPPADFFR